jgi:hypothetical protein
MELALVQIALLEDSDMPQPLAVDRRFRQAFVGAVHVALKQVDGGISERDGEHRHQAPPAIFNDVTK